MLMSDAARIVDPLERVPSRAETPRGLMRTTSSTPVPRPARASREGRTPTPAFDVRPYLDEMPRWKPKSELRRGESQRTHGRWVGSETDREWVSGETGDRYASLVQERWEREQPGGSDQTRTFPVAGHVEIKFAQYMREHGLTEERIVINNPSGPCPIPFGCERFLPWLLGPGLALTVDYPGGTRTFVGTGTIA